MKGLAVAVVLISITLVGCDESTGSGASSPTSSGSRTVTTENSGGASENPGETTRVLTIDASGGEKVEVHVEIADDDFEQARGLMYRTALADNRGMLFVYPDEEERSFWMRNTLIPLSIAFIDSEERIVDIQDMKPLDDDPPHYVSAEPAQYALEVNKGFFEERGVEVGDRANLPV
jgi:uncharacterized membrane protein (UPF0127 family)